MQYNKYEDVSFFPKKVDSLYNTILSHLPIIFNNKPRKHIPAILPL